MTQRPSRPQREWLAALNSSGQVRDHAIDRLRDLLVDAARFEVARRRDALAFVDASELDDLAMRAADDALVAVMSKLDEFDRTARFAPWACKFALLEAAMRLRRRAWQADQVARETKDLRASLDAIPSPHTAPERRQLAAIRDCIAHELTPAQQSVVVALVIDGVPIDVLSERMGITRGALYETLHQGRTRMRARLALDGLANDAEQRPGTAAC